MAKRFLRAIKDRLLELTHAYKKLQVDFAPEGGFDAQLCFNGLPTLST